MQKLKNKFINRNQLIKYVSELVIWIDGKELSIICGYKRAQENLKIF